VRHVHVDAQLRQQVFRQRQRAGDARLECLAALLAHERVGILALGQEEEADLAPVLCLGQHVLQRAPCRRATGAVAVEGEHDLVHQPERAPQVLGRRCRAERRDRVVQPRLVQARDVHVTLDDEQALQRQARLSRFIQAVELAALMEQRRLGRIEVLRLAAVDHAAAEADDPAARVADREHHAIAEAVVERVLARRRSLAPDDEAGREQRALRLLGCAEAAQHLLPGVRRIADAKLLQRLEAQAPAAHVLARTFILGELLGIESGDATEQVREPLGSRALRRLARFARYLEPEALRQLLHRLRKRQLVVLDQEAERAAVGAAAEAMEELLVRADPERGRLFVVERAASLELAPGFLQRHAFADQLDDIGAADQLVDEALGNAAGHASSLTAVDCIDPGWRVAAPRRVQAGVDRRALIRAPSAPMSARPCTFALSAFMTLPMSLMLAAPVSAMVAAMSWSSSCAESCSGR
jgi:hypothetical protein